MSAWRITGRVRSGLGHGAGFTRLPWARDAFIERLGIDPHPGTLNLEAQASGPPGGVRIVPPGPGACAASCHPVRIAGRFHGAVVVPEVDGYPAGQVEVICAVNLREHLAVADGDEVELVAARQPRLRAMIFDVDGTLVNSVEGIALAASRAAADFGIEVSLDHVRYALDGGESLWRIVAPDAVRDDARLAERLRTATLREWARVLEASVTPFAGVAGTLERLRSAGLRLAICTGSRGESFLPLERSGLLGLFDPVVTAAHVARPKPDPEGLRLCLDRLGCDAAEAAYVGDTRHDMQAARAAGVYAIGVLTGAASASALTLAGADTIVPRFERLDPG